MVFYTHVNDLIFENKNRGGGPITYQIIILYSISSSVNTVNRNFSNIFYVFLCIELC